MLPLLFRRLLEYLLDLALHGSARLVKRLLPGQATHRRGRGLAAAGLTNSHRRAAAAAAAAAAALLRGLRRWRRRGAG